MLISVRVSTNSSKQGVEKISDNDYKVRVRAKPIEGKANAEVVGLLADHFGVQTANVRILRGFSSNKKLVEINAL